MSAMSADTLSRRRAALAGRARVDSSSGGGAALALPLDVAGRGENAAIGERAAVGEAEGGAVALGVAVGELAQRAVVADEDGRVLQHMGAPGLRHQRDARGVARRLRGGGVALRELAGGEEQQVESGLGLVERVHVTGGLAGVPAPQRLAAEEEALRVRIVVVPAHALRQVEGDAAALFLAAVEAGGEVGLREGPELRPRLLHALAGLRQQLPGIGGAGGAGGAAGMHRA